MMTGSQFPIVLSRLKAPWALPRCDEPRQSALSERVYRLIRNSRDIETRKDLGGDLVCDCILNGWIAGQRCHGRHIAVGVGDQVLGPNGHYRERREDAADHDQQGGDH
jgi:hypothetical protein